MKSGNNILITGAAGQLGIELTAKLREEFGAENVIATDIRESEKIAESGPFEMLDVLDKNHLAEIIRKYKIDTIYHLAAILSAKGEANIKKTWQLNVDGLLNVLELAREGLPGDVRRRSAQSAVSGTESEFETDNDSCSNAGTDSARHSKSDSIFGSNVASTANGRVFWPSSIAVFGPDLPRKNTPQDSPLNPLTVYGITKVAGEQWCAYYHRKFGIDVRSLRFPGLIGYKSEPGGGTTDYAVDMLRSAAKGHKFKCPVGPKTRLPMMYMEDAVQAALDLMVVDPERVRIRTSYNVTAMSFSPEELHKAIRNHVNGFQITYHPDQRDAIAASWPESIDDSPAREDWNWEHRYDLPSMVREVLHKLNSPG